MAGHARRAAVCPPSRTPAACWQGLLPPPGPGQQHAGHAAAAPAGRLPGPAWASGATDAGIASASSSACAAHRRHGRLQEDVRQDEGGRLGRRGQARRGGCCAESYPGKAGSTSACGRAGGRLRRRMEPLPPLAMQLGACAEPPLALHPTLLLRRRTPSTPRGSGSSRAASRTLAAAKGPGARPVVGAPVAGGGAAAMAAARAASGRPQVRARAACACGRWSPGEAAHAVGSHLGLTARCWARVAALWLQMGGMAAVLRSPSARSCWRCSSTAGRCCATWRSS